MKHNEEQNLIYRIIEFGMEKQVFTKLELFTALKLTNQEGHAVSGEAQQTVDYIGKYLINGDPQNVLPNQIIGELNRTTFPLHWQYQLLTSAVFQYEDYQEIRLARENAQQARYFSIIAIGISLVGTLVAIWQLILQAKGH